MDRADDGEDGQFGIYAAQAAIPHTVLYDRDEARVEFATACLDEATVLLAQSAGLVDDAASSQLFADRGRVSRQDGPQSLCPVIARAAGLERTLRNAQRELVALEKDLLLVPHVVVKGALRNIEDTCYLVEGGVVESVPAEDPARFADDRVAFQP